MSENRQLFQSERTDKTSPLCMIGHSPTLQCQTTVAGQDIPSETVSSARRNRALQDTEIGKGRLLQEKPKMLKELRQNI
jgi:hypothetical protein